MTASRPGPGPGNKRRPVSRRDDTPWLMLPDGWSPGPCVLGVPHHGAIEMVGMLTYHHVDDDLVFFHGHTDSQRFRRDDIGAPIDLCVVDLLARYAVTRIYDFEQTGVVRGSRSSPGGKSGVLRRTTVGVLADRGVALMSGGRARVGLHDGEWVARGVVEYIRTTDPTPSRPARQLERVYVGEPDAQRRFGELFVLPWIRGPKYAIPARSEF